jgi:hypothetical protein
VIASAVVDERPSWTGLDILIGLIAATILVGHVIRVRANQAATASPPDHDYAPLLAALPPSARLEITACSTDLGVPTVTWRARTNTCIISETALYDLTSAELEFLVKAQQHMKWDLTNRLYDLAWVMGNDAMGLAGISALTKQVEAHRKLGRTLTERRRAAVALLNLNALKWHAIPQEPRP